MQVISYSYVQALKTPPLQDITKQNTKRCARTGNNRYCIDECNLYVLLRYSRIVVYYSNIRLNKKRPRDLLN